MIQEGTRLPDFSLSDSNGKTWTLSDFAGKVFVLYFYPKDETPGCTIEACEFRDAYEEYRKRGVEVVGVSPDKAASHSKFASRHSLPFILLADPDKSLLSAVGAYGEKSMYGRKVMGVIRSTLVVDGEGKVLKVFPKVSPKGHAEEILASLP